MLGESVLTIGRESKAHRVIEPLIVREILELRSRYDDGNGVDAPNLAARIDRKYFGGKGRLSYRLIEELLDHVDNNDLTVADFMGD